MFNDIKHISFDVWNTLIEPNKEYSKFRNAAIARHFDITEQEAKEAYSQCKKFLDTVAELDGSNMHGAVRNWQLLERIIGASRYSLDYLIAECNVLFSNFKPHFDDELKLELKKLKDDGYTFSIKSNTNFITGTVLKDVLFDELELFEFMHFSDLEGRFAKPHPVFFLSTENYFYFTEKVKSQNILHIGDNLICDGGCQKLGWNFLHVLNPKDLLNKLKNQEIV